MKYYDVSVSNLMQKVTSKLISDIHYKRNKVITARLKEIVGIDLNIKEEANRRFKRLAKNIKELRKLFIMMTAVLKVSE